MNANNGAPSNEGFEGGNPGEWETPSPLPGRTNPLPTDAAGPILGPLAKAIGEALQVPTDLPINLGLPLITTAAKGAWIACVDGGWTEPLCLSTVSVLASGERKSPTLKLLDAPLRKFERDTQDEKRPEIAKEQARKKLIEGRVEELRKKAMRELTAGGKNEQAYLDQVAHLETLQIDPLPRWLVDDATPEKFVSLLDEHGAFGAVSAEPGLFGILAGRYSGGTPNIEWFLKATSGEVLTTDRIGRDGDQVDNPALSVASCLQPGRVGELGKVKAFRDSGLLARQLYVIPASNVGTRGRTQQVDQDLLDMWSLHLTVLAEAAIKRRESGSHGRLFLTGEARDELEEFRGQLEPHLHPDHGRLAGIADWANKLPGAAVRIAAALTLLEDPTATDITAATIRNAIELAKAYISHATAVFGLTRPDGEIYSQAKQVLGVIRRWCGEKETPIIPIRDVHQKLRDRAWVENRDTLNRPIEILIDYGHIRHVEAEPGVGRPSPKLELHPSYLAEKPPRNPQNL